MQRLEWNGIDSLKRLIIESCPFDESCIQSNPNGGIRSSQRQGRNIREEGGGGVYYELEVGLDGGADLAEVLHRVVAPAFAAAAVRRRRRGGGGGGRVERVHPCQRKACVCACPLRMDGWMDGMDGFESGNGVVSWLWLWAGTGRMPGGPRRFIYVGCGGGGGGGRLGGWDSRGKERKGSGRALGWYFSRRNTPQTQNSRSRESRSTDCSRSFSKTACIPVPLGVHLTQVKHRLAASSRSPFVRPR